MKPVSILRIARIYRPTPYNLARLALVLRKGGVVGVPSETVYGLAADALNPAACAKIFEIKGRPTTDPLIVHLAHARELSQVAVAGRQALALAAAFWPGPLTLVLPKLPVVPLLVTAGRETVAVRVPAHPVFRKLIRLTGRPLAAPSANPFGYISPTCAAHVREGLGGCGLGAILDGGACGVGVESTIVDMTQPDRPRLLRPGGLGVVEIERVLGIKLLPPLRRTIAVNESAPAPGMLSRHYSPRTPVVLHAKLVAESIFEFPADEAYLLHRKPAEAVLQIMDPDLLRRLRWLSVNGEIAEIAKNLFAVLRSLDAEKWAKIHVARVAGGEGLALAINDRLSRAAAKD